MKGDTIEAFEVSHDMWEIYLNGSYSHIQDAPDMGDFIATYKNSFCIQIYPNWKD